MLSALTSFAADKQSQYEDIATLKAQIEKTVLAAYSNREHNKVTVKASNLDARLKLNRCSIPKSVKLNGNQLRTSNTSVRVSCNGDSPWSIFVPVRIDVYQSIAVATRDILKGEIIMEADISLEERSLGNAGFGYTNSPQQLIGQAVTRNISSGSAVRTVHVTQPIVVKRGDKLTLQAGRGGLAVITYGTAMSKGRVGDRIRVKNENSKRIVDARVVAAGQAVAAL